MTAGEYIRSRVATLKPPMDSALNPIKAMRMLNKEQWNFFGCAWSGWIMDAFDFFTVSLTLPLLAAEFRKKDSDITWGITLTLMFRPLGAFIFGYLSDRFGRRWPFIVNNLMFIVLELGTGFCRTYNEFLICRAFFGVAMGGIYGNSVSTALEDCPHPSRGIMSGLFQSGYPLGYVLATAMSRALVGTTEHGWRPLFWFSACPPVFIIVWRLMLPETRAFRERELVSKSSTGAAISFRDKAWIALRDHWLTIVYMVFLMSGFSFISHGAQDLYPTMLTEEFEFGADQLAVTQVVANIGGFLGAICVGNLSEIFGRRLAIITSCIVAASVLYPYTTVKTPAVTAAAFFLQFATQGAFGVLPSHLMELSPADIRSIVVGTAYQLGTLASSGSATIQSEVGENYFPLPPGRSGGKRYDYGLVICVFLGAAIALVVITTFLGPEHKGRQFGLDVDEAIEGTKEAGSGSKPKSEFVEAESV
ncbi:Carboxylic acid transporter [Conoideocrella luteorostrata]|uniref:Carboxylic acid transporter n=1 Tax=Conoideocrella luteorostrata TaxID=1105319 RepID=A0AAJ0CXG2_9HYPO|nr:Carboxylic acid transporter [Conoideocrella luteorostrata]